MKSSVSIQMHCRDSTVKLTDADGFREGHIGIEFIVDTRATVARAHTEPILVVVVGALVALGRR